MSLIKNSIIYSIGRIIPQLAGFILLPIYTDHLSPAEYGIVQSIQILISVFSIVFSFATERSLFRLYYDYKNEKDQKQLIGNVFISVLVISTSIFFLLFIFKSYVGKIYTSISFFPYYYFGIITSYALSLVYIPQTILQVQGKAFNFVALSLLGFISSICFILYFVLIKEQGAMGMLKGQMLGNLFPLPIYLFVTLKNSELKINKSIIKNIFSFSLPILPSLLATWALNMSNRIFIERFLSLADVGIFSLAFKLASLILIITSSLFTAYNPFFYKIANTYEKQKAKEILFKTTTLFLQIALMVSLLIPLFSREIITYLLDDRYFSANKYILFLSLAIFLSQVTGIYNLMLYQNKRTRLNMYITILGAFISIFLYYIFIKYFGLYGAVFSLLLSYLVILILKVMYAKRGFYIPISIKSLLVIAVPLTLILVIEFIFNFNEITFFLFKLTSVIILALIFYKRNLHKLKYIIKET